MNVAGRRVWKEERGWEGAGGGSTPTRCMGRWMGNVELRKGGEYLEQAESG